LPCPKNLFRNQAVFSVAVIWGVIVDIRTVKLMLAVGSFLLGLLLIIFKFKRKNPQEVPFWIRAKMLQAIGSLMLYCWSGSFDAFSALANAVLIMGCAYEAWAVRFLTGKLVKRRFHISVSAGIILVCFITIFLSPPYNTGLVFLVHSIFYILPGLFLFKKSDEKYSLQTLLAACYSVTGSVFFITSILCIGFPGYALSLSGRTVSGIIPLVSFCIFLMSGFILLMFAKERSEMQLREIQQNLKKTEFRFQQIVETAIEGIAIFDGNYRITFANQNMASMLGYTIDEMIGREYVSFFPADQLHVYHAQEALRKKGKSSVYECRLLRKDGKTNWFLVSAKAIMNDAGRFDGSFAMFTDINKRKEMELLLEETNRRLVELSNQDSLTGIANRRLFDATLEHEYQRLRRTNTELSIILLDIDHFKEYNDYYGHVAGDDCLRQIGGILTSSINRALDLAARYGGEEFACILPDTDIHGAVRVAGRIRQKIMDLKIEHKKSPVSSVVTASFGVTTIKKYSPEISPEDIVSKADKLLYKAKVSGRNRIEYARFEED